MLVMHQASPSVLSAGVNRGVNSIYPSAFSLSSSERKCSKLLKSFVNLCIQRHKLVFDTVLSQKLLSL